MTLPNADFSMPYMRIAMKEPYLKMASIGSWRPLVVHLLCRFRGLWPLNTGDLMLMLPPRFPWNFCRLLGLLSDSTFERCVRRKRVLSAVR